MLKIRHILKRYILRQYISKRYIVKQHFIKQVSLFLTIVLFTNVITGCWDRVEIEQLAYITLVGIDSAGPDEVLVTFQTIIPRMLGKGQGSSGGGGSSTPANPYINYSVRARNISDAVRLFELKNPRSALFKTAQAVIIGEDLARKDIIPPLDFFTRTPLMRRSIWVLVSVGKAADVLAKGDPGPENFLAKTIRTIFLRRRDVALVNPVNFGQFLSMLERPGRDPSIPIIKLFPETRVCFIDSFSQSKKIAVQLLGFLEGGHDFIANHFFLLLLQFVDTLTFRGVDRFILDTGYITLFFDLNFEAKPFLGNNWCDFTFP
jgi:hypothetical protein